MDSERIDLSGLSKYFSNDVSEITKVSSEREREREREREKRKDR